MVTTKYGLSGKDDDECALWLNIARINDGREEKVFGKTKVKAIVFFEIDQGSSGVFWRGKHARNGEECRAIIDDFCYEYLELKGGSRE